MGLFDIFKGNAFTNAEKAKLAAIDPLKFVSIDAHNELMQQAAELIQAMPKPVDTSNFVTMDSLPDLSAYALAKDVPSIAGLATVKQLPNLTLYALAKDIPKLPDMSKYMLKTEVSDTVKYIENSNTKSAIKKISLSIDDKGTFKPDSNPADNIAHTI